MYLEDIANRGINLFFSDKIKYQKIDKLNDKKRG